ncbi:polysaccharide deacetylase family protein [Chitinophaga sedimenti]|uniref:polysaccharide deacetylase family protein n=1 Tax=Chitinophaga sedimenti TaxID=2033606 RepID=UPI0020037C07|nr:polysaccharide deacetylase family protein [Chitinophaga sedimenti]MCK7559087.1 polysaccharide deacetylase family protein [Chitinophaga sedimenti]
MFYFTKTPALLKNIYRSCTWSLSPTAPVVYFTFDDGPHPQATPFVLDQLQQYNAKATFFCIGKNVVEQPDIYQRILTEGHAVGNHTHNHLNGWKTGNKTYLENIRTAGSYIKSNLFRPPYGRVSPFQIRQLKPDFHIIMWDVLSADFDTEISGEQCLQNVVFKLQKGSIIVFHDSAKAWERLEYALPRALAFCKKKGWRMEALPQYQPK